MKKRILCFLLAVCLILPCAFSLTACNDNPEVSYTVTEAQWKMNFNLTKGQTSASPSSVSDSDDVTDFSGNLSAITSYTLSAVGINYGLNGSCELKVAPNGMSIEFYLEGVRREDESGVTPSSDPFYVGLTSSVMSYFPFKENYNDFTFDQTKNAYVAENFTTYVVNEEDIDDTYPLYTKIAEVTFRNGYLNTITIQLAEDTTYTDVYSSFVFTFTNINKTTVNVL